MIIITIMTIIIITIMTIIIITIMTIIIITTTTTTKIIKKIPRIDDYLILNLLEMPMMIVFVLLVMVNILPSYIVVNKLVELADIVIVSPVLVLSFLGKKIIYGESFYYFCCCCCCYYYYCHYCYYYYCHYCSLAFLIDLKLNNHQYRKKLMVFVGNPNK
jgi:hypothetical protein